jgi:hypothetical protein
MASIPPRPPWHPYRDHEAIGRRDPILHDLGHGLRETCRLPLIKAYIEFGLIVLAALSFVGLLVWFFRPWSFIGLPLLGLFVWLLIRNA